jgi:hypothetical protein
MISIFRSSNAYLIFYIVVVLGRLASAPGTNRMQSLKTLISCVSLHGQTLTEVRHAQDKVSILFFANLRHMEELGEQYKSSLLYFSWKKGGGGGGGNPTPNTHTLALLYRLVGGNKYAKTTLHWSRSYFMTRLKHNLIQGC